MAKTKKHAWSFENIGGSTRVKITTGADIANLDQLDPKMWTVLSCPSTGLEIDEKSLKYIDTDNDGRIRVNDIVATAKWMTAAIKNPDLLLKGEDSINLNDLNQEDATGKKLYRSAKEILANLGKEGDTISIADTADTAAIFAQTRYNGDGIITEFTTDDLDEKAAIAAAIASVGSVADRSGEKGVNAELIEKFYQALADFTAWKAAEVEAPYGADTDKAIEAYNALDAKVKDYFVRARLASFAPESATKLDVQTALIETISAENLTGKTDEIAAYPIARITDKPELPIDATINPAWADKFKTLIAIIQPKEKSITKAIESFSDLGSGFNIAMQDLDIRGAGNLLGAEQSGFITDMGFETYQKILAEAMEELGMETGISSKASSDNYVSDCTIETDQLALIPDDYIDITAEKIRIYKELDSLSSDKEMEQMKKKLSDRFGEIPEELARLFEIVKIRQLGQKLGFEKIIVKNGVMIAFFIYNSMSRYYRSERFSKILENISLNPKLFELKQNDNKLRIFVKNVDSLSKAYQILNRL